MKKYGYILSLVFMSSLLFSSCSKEKIEFIESNDPVFRLDGTISGEDFSLVAGDDNAYMFTETQVINGVNLYSGRISNGTRSVEIGVYDGNIDVPASNAIVDIANYLTEFSHYIHQPLAILSKDEFENSQNISEIIWYIDNTYAGVNTVEILEPGKYNVRADISFIGGGQSISVENDLILGFSRNANCSIEYITSSGYVYASLTDVSGAAVDTIIWSLNGAIMTTGASANFAIPAGHNDVSAEVHFSNGVVRTKNISVHNSQNSRNIEDFTMFETGTSSTLCQDYMLRLKYTNDGNEYSTEFAPNSQSTIQIVNIEYYDKNSAGKSVYKVEAIVDAVLGTQNSSKEIPISFTTFFGIEIP